MQEKITSQSNKTLRFVNKYSGCFGLQKQKNQTYYADNIVRPNCTVTCTIGLISVKESIFDVHSKIVRKY